MKPVKRLTYDALLLAAALILSYLESQIPPFIPVPGIKLGISNIVTVFAIYMTDRQEAFLILLARIFIMAVFSGQSVSFLYSLAGGIACFVLMVLMKKILNNKQIFICSIVGAIAHNTAQILVASFLLQSKEILFYLPILTVSAIFTGSITGIIAQSVISRFRKE